MNETEPTTDPTVAIQVPELPAPAASPRKPSKYGAVLWPSHLGPASYGKCATCADDRVKFVDQRGACKDHTDASKRK